MKGSGWKVSPVRNNYWLQLTTDSSRLLTELWRSFKCSPRRAYYPSATLIKHVTAIIVISANYFRNCVTVAVNSFDSSLFFKRELQSRLNHTEASICRLRCCVVNGSSLSSRRHETEVGLMVGVGHSAPVDHRWAAAASGEWRQNLMIPSGLGVFVRRWRQSWGVFADVKVNDFSVDERDLRGPEWQQQGCWELLTAGEYTPWF